MINCQIGQEVVTFTDRIATITQDGKKLRKSAGLLILPFTEGIIRELRTTSRKKCNAAIVFFPQYQMAGKYYFRELEPISIIKQIWKEKWYA